MLWKLNKIRTSFFAALIILISSFNYVQATSDVCEAIEVDKKSTPLVHKKYLPSYVNSLIQTEQARYHLTLAKAKGRVGELLARDIIERGYLKLSGKNVVSVTTMFQNKRCRIQEALRSEADQGIDDIFVVLRADGWIDQRYNPIFHESKYDGRCNLKLKDTRTLCGQLSVQWLDRNLKKVQSRSSANSWICFNEHNDFIVQSCTECTNEFKENISWLQSMLTTGSFHRTASLLCADGNLRIYNVNGHN